MSTSLPTSPPRSREDEPPEVASARRYLRTNLPSMYRREQDGFTMRMLGSFERVLDPQVAILDCLAAYLSPSMAPESMVVAMAAWLGQPPAASYGESAGRGLLDVAERLARLRGTRAGLELALRECFPKLHFEVDDHGSVLSADPTATATAAAPYPGFTVRCREPLSPIQRERIGRVIDWQRPLQVKYTLLDPTDTRESPR